MKMYILRGNKRLEVIDEGSRDDNNVLIAAFGNR